MCNETTANNDCPECCAWKPKDQKVCRECRVYTDIHLLTVEQLAALGPEGNPKGVRDAIESIR